MKNILTGIASLFYLSLCSYWAYTTINIWLHTRYSAIKTFLLCILWLLGAFILAFINGMSIKSIALSNENYIMVIGACWALLFVITAVYPWFLGSYNTSLVIQRVIWDYVVLNMAVWSFLMVAMIGASK